MSRDDHDYDESFLNIVDEELTNMTSQSHEQPNITLNEISEEVCKVIQSLQLGKAPGPNKIQPEHIRYGGSALVYHLATLLNLIVELEYIPRIFQ